MDTDAKMTLIHAVGAIIAGYASFITSNGSIAVIGENQAIGSFVGIVILIIVGKISEKILNDSEVDGFSGWLWTGIVPFALIWFLTWTVFINLKFV